MAGEIIYILDRIVAKPGRGKALFDQYSEKYVPVAQQRGLELRNRWVSPPVWLSEQSNTLCILWSVSGVAGYWGVEQQARFDATSGDFWREIEPYVASRTRSVMAEADDVESLCNV